VPSCITAPNASAVLPAASPPSSMMRCFYASLRKYRDASA
jgi:hypothetical protein